MNIHPPNRYALVVVRAKTGGVAEALAAPKLFTHGPAMRLGRAGPSYWPPAVLFRVGPLLTTAHITVEPRSEISAFAAWLQEQT